MALNPGTRLGAYEIVSAIGAGGMGEVYRARDLKLDRDAAIKILPEAFATDRDRLMRFEREAKTLAALNHPGIAQIHGVEEAPSTGSGQAGIRALVMEFVPGPTLDEIISGSWRSALGSRVATAQAPSAGSQEPWRDSHNGLELQQALSIARQIVVALEAAHEQGIIHRDLKPANIKVRPDGTVKLLDFGLAKALEPPQADAAASPTMTSPAAMTQQGIILGTAAYMSPEQARGKPVDKRADVWAFGCVLFEMLSGEHAFPGEGVSDTIAAVLRGEPEWSALPAETPAALRRLIRRCLIKDPKDRLADLSAARLDIDDASGAAAAKDAETSVLPPGVPSSRVRLSRLAMSAAFGAVITAGVSWALWPEPVRTVPVHLTIDLPPNQKWSGPSGPGVAISKDGRLVAYTAQEAGEGGLFLRPLDADKARAVSGADQGYAPFFSPDSRELGFFAKGKLWRVSVSEGTPPFPITTIDVRVDRGATWAIDGFVYIGSESGISRVPASGGTRETVTTVDRANGEIAHRFPEVLPDGRGILFTILRGALDDARIGLIDLGAKRTRTLFDRPGHAARYVATGHVVFLQAGALMAVPFDLSRLDVEGTPHPVLSGIDFNSGGAGHFGVSDTGVLVYVPKPEMTRATPVWADRAGRTESAGPPADAYRSLALSPDGRRLALARGALPTESDIVIWDFTRRSFTHLTRNPAALNTAPMWMPDGETVAFTARPRGVGSPSYLFKARVDAAGAPERIALKDVEALSSAAAQVPRFASADGKDVVFSQLGTRANGLYVLHLATSEAQVIEAGQIGYAALSPDGRWLAYQRGAGELWVRSYPDVTGKMWPISTSGEFAAGWGLSGPAETLSLRWSRDSRELFYRTGSTIMVATLDPRSGFASVRPKVLFDAPGASLSFDVSGDGKLLLLRAEALPESVPQVIVNWFEVLKSLVPAK